MPLHAGANRQAEKRRLGSYIGWADCEKEWERASASFRLASRKKVGIRRADTVTRCFLLHLVVEGFFLIFFFFLFCRSAVVAPGVPLLCFLRGSITSSNFD